MPYPRKALPGHVHLWLHDIGPSGRDVARCEAVLTEEERARADRFRFEKHRSRFVRGRAFLREVVASFCGCDPRDLGLAADEQGKPFVIGCPVAFNLSHSGDVALLGIAAMSEIGVDVECFDRALDCVPLARRFFAESECAAVEALDGSGQSALFLRFWTSKEAAMKATGEGLRIDPRKIEVILDKDLRPKSYEGIFAGWHLINVDQEEYGATLSVAAPQAFFLQWEA